MVASRKSLFFPLDPNQTIYLAWIQYPELNERRLALMYPPGLALDAVRYLDRMERRLRWFRKSFAGGPPK
jgi:hypothetical protein